MGIAVFSLATSTLSAAVVFRRPSIARSFVGPLGVAATLLAGLTYGAAAARLPEAVRLADHQRGAHESWRVRGYLLTDPARMGTNWSVDLVVEAIFVDRAWKAWPLRVRTVVYETDFLSDWTAGNRFETFLRVRPDRPASNPLVGMRPDVRASGADVRSSLKSFRQLRRRPGGAFHPRRPIAAVRFAIRRSTVALFPKNAPLIDALLLGERGELQRTLLSALARTGLIHVIAISGLHVGIFVSGLFAALRVAGLAVPRAAVVCLLTLPMIYALVVPRPAVGRACVMAATVLCGVALGRRTSALNGLALATLLLTLRDPWATQDMGFQLSTAATAAIIAVGVPAGGSHRLGRMLAGSFLVSCAAQIGVASILATTTHRLPLVAIPLSLVAVPAAGIAIIAATGALGMYSVGADRLAHLFAAAADGALDTIQSLAIAVDTPGRGLSVPAAAAAWMLPSTLVAIGLLAAYHRLSAHRPRPLASLISGTLAVSLVAITPATVMFVVKDPRPRSDHLRLVALDIGQGDALLVETADATVIVDTGGRPGSDFDPGVAVIAPALRARGVRSLDAVAITHFHADHVGGLRGVLAELPTRQVWAPSAAIRDPASRNFHAAVGDIPVVTLAGGDVRRQGKCTWRAVHPSGRRLDIGDTPVSNNGSLVLSVGCNATRVLLTGDTERAAESEYVDGSDDLRAAVLKSPHHGSSTSSSDVLLDAVQARHVVISAGWRNRFGLPSVAVLERYRNRQMAVYRTDRDGAVTVDVGSRIRVRGERWSAGRGRERRGGWLH